MRKIVKKFSLRRRNMNEASYIHTIDMPEGAKIIHLGVEFIEPVFWALIDDDEEGMEKRQFLCIKDHEEMEEDANLKYLGTYILQQGHIIEHVFEILD